MSWSVCVSHCRCDFKLFFFPFFPLWRNRVILLFSGVSLLNGGWYWTHCVAQLPTASPRRNKLKQVGKRMGKNQQVPLFISLLNMSSHVSWGELLSTCRKDSKGCEGEERIAIQKSGHTTSTEPAVKHSPLSWLHIWPLNPVCRPEGRNFLHRPDTDVGKQAVEMLTRY